MLTPSLLRLPASAEFTSFHPTGHLDAFPSFLVWVCFLVVLPMSCVDPHCWCLDSSGHYWNLLSSNKGLQFDFEAWIERLRQWWRTGREFSILHVFPCVASSLFFPRSYLQLPLPFRALQYFPPPLFPWSISSSFFFSSSSLFRNVVHLVSWTCLTSETIQINTNN